jgi:hypothetical protein
LDKLQKTLSSLVGDDVAKEWVDRRYDRKVQYGLPADKQGRYTPYGTLTNLDVRPEKYLNTRVPITVVPRNEWKTLAGGEYGALAGLRIPREQPTGRFDAANVAVHEGQHAQDYTPTQQFGKPYDDSKTLRELLNTQNSITHRAFTMRDDIGEAVPEARDYLSQQPAWHRMEGTEMFQKLSNEAKAMLLRHLMPTPKGYDAISGVDYNF